MKAKTEEKLEETEDAEDIVDEDDGLEEDLPAQGDGDYWI